MTAVTWNPSDKHANIVLSNGDLTATSNAASWKSVRATEGKSSGKWYFEVKMDVVAAGYYMILGVGSPDANLSGFCGSDAYGWGYFGTDGKKIHSNVQVVYGAAFGVNDIIGVAVDIDAHKVWWSKNGAWQGGGNPAAGTGAAYDDIDAGELKPMFSPYSSTNAGTGRFKSADLTYSPPSGFSAWEYEEEEVHVLHLLNVQRLLSCPAQAPARRLNIQRSLNEYPLVPALLNVQRNVVGITARIRLLNAQRDMFVFSWASLTLNVQRYVSFPDEQPERDLNIQRSITVPAPVPRLINVERMIPATVGLSDLLSLQRNIITPLTEDMRVSMWDGTNTFQISDLSFLMLKVGISREVSFYLWNDRGGDLEESQTLKQVQIGVLCSNGEYFGQELPFGQEIVDEKWVSVKSNGILGSGISDDEQEYEAVGGTTKRAIGDIPPECARLIHVKMTAPVGAETLIAWALLFTSCEVE